MAAAVEPKYRRVLLKLSGEALSSASHAIDPEVVAAVAEDLKPVVDVGVQVAVVIGAGNIFRGMSSVAADMNRAIADSMGMLGTVINALALQDGFRRAGVTTAAMSAISMPTMCEPYSRRRAIELLEQGTVVLLGGGTGNPYFTTDTAAVLRGLEVGAGVVMKATKVDGVYDKDPKRHPDAKKYDRLTHNDVVERGLRVMDATAATLCQEGGLPIVVFSMLTRGNILRAVLGEPIGTLVEPSSNKTEG
jgi:uridylate kinase